jgi:hypothetical protein
MQIENKDIRPGDNLIFKRNDKLALILSLVIKLFYPKWYMWGWHMAVVVWPESDDWIVLEATWPIFRNLLIVCWGSAMTDFSIPGRLFNTW